MGPWVGGFIPIIIYGGLGATVLDENAILTENNFDLLTESSNSILTE